MRRRSKKLNIYNLLRAFKGKKKLLVAGTLITGIVIGSITPSVSSLIGDGFGISEPYLVHVGGVPNTPILAVKELTDTRHVLHIIMRPVFKNRAFKRGHVGKVKVAANGLEDIPEEVQLIYLDSSELAWFQEKEIRCEFLVIINPATMGPQPSTVTFKVYFYGPKGNELYWEGINIEGWRQEG
jgi:hypothetical protein